MHLTQSVFIITLNPSGHEVQLLSDSLVREGLEPHLFSAVDGRIGKPDLEQLCPSHLVGVSKSSHTILTGSELGCYLSHLSAVQQAYDQGLSHVTILEDDVSVVEGMGNVIKEIAALPESYHFTRLMGLRPRARKIVRSLSETHSITRPVKGLFGTQGYTLNRAGMSHVLAAGANITYPIDVFYDQFWESGIRCFCVEPHVIEHIERPTNIVLPPERHIGKLKEKVALLKSSLKRRFYLLRHFGDFFPYSKNK